jgi:hypothetical protein
MPSEEELDAPSRQTLWMLGIMASATLAMWVMGRVACNYHVPGESLTPRALSAEERSKSSYDAAMEFARAIEAGDFATARLVATGAALSFVEEQEKACSDCAARQSAKEAIRMVGVVQEDNGKEGYVSVTVQGGARGEQKSLLHVVRGPKSFQVSEVLPLDAKIPKLERPSAKTDSSKGTNAVPPLLRRPSEPASSSSEEKR